MNKNITVETVIAALKYDFDTIDKQNFEDKVLIVNQCNDNRVYEFNKNIKVIESESRGIGANRLLGQQYYSGDIIVLADDDEVFDEGYTKIIKDAYEQNPDADMIMFNVRRSGDSRRETFSLNKSIKLNYFNSLKFGAVNITFKSKSISKKKIYFDDNFGIRPFLFGEDTAFIYDSLKQGLNLYYVNLDIANVDLSDSSWFSGYNREYFIAKGAQFYRISKFYSYLLMFQFVVRKGHIFSNEISRSKAMIFMIKGKNIYKKNKKEECNGEK